MIIKTPSLSVRSVKVFPALFKAQLPDTITAIRRAIPDWAAVHVIAEGGAAKRGATHEEMRDEILAEVHPLAMLHEPIYTLTTPEIPPNTVATFAPDQLKPKFATAHQGWKYVFYPRARAALKELLDRAVGGIPEGNVGVADALVKGEIQGQAVLEGWTASIALPSYKRTMEALVDPAGKVMFWDTVFGYETSGEGFMKMSEGILGMLGVKQDRLYFDATNSSWFAVFYPGGQMRIGMLG